MSEATIAGPRPCAAIASPPTKRLAISRRRFSVVWRSLLGALTVVSVGEGSAVPASASTGPNLVVNGLAPR